MLTHTALVLHGGGGPATVANLVAHLASSYDVIAPVHPGWEGTDPVPGDTIRDLAARYLEDLPTGSVVVGSSIGGWIAAAMATQDQDAVIDRLVLIDNVGIEVADEPIIDFFALDARGIAEHAWADPERGFIDPTTLTPERAATMQGNGVALRSYATDPYMHDPNLDLTRVVARTLVVWGSADRIVTPAYGTAVADRIAGATFTMIDGAGHLPHLEKPAETFAALDAFLAG